MRQMTNWFLAPTTGTSISASRCVGRGAALHVHLGASAQCLGPAYLAIVMPFHILISRGPFADGRLNARHRSHSHRPRPNGPASGPQRCLLRNRRSAHRESRDQRRYRGAIRTSAWRQSGGREKRSRHPVRPNAPIDASPTRSGPASAAGQGVRAAGRQTLNDPQKNCQHGHNQQDHSGRPWQAPQPPDTSAKPRTAAAPVAQMVQQNGRHAGQHRPLHRPVAREKTLRPGQAAPKPAHALPAVPPLAPDAARRGPVR